MELYLFYHEVIWGKEADSLYKLKLPSLPASKIQTCPQEEEVLTPILEFPMDKYPHSMGCVQFNSKLYFFGGSFGPPYELIDNFETDDDLTHQLYPANVYVFDPNDDVLNQVASMTTGKPEPFGFVANEMIYAVGGSVRRSYKYSNHLIKRFERFNPVDETWQVLDDSPLQCITNCVGATVIENQHKVLITAWKGYQLVRLLYDFVHDRWDSEQCLVVRPSPYPDFHISASDYNGREGFLYGIRPKMPCPVPIKLGPLMDLKDLDKLHNLPIVDLSTIDPTDWKVKAAFSRSRMCPRSKILMLRLGDGYFCHVVTGKVCPRDDNIRFPCSHTCKVSVTIFKELSNPVGVGMQQEAQGRAFAFEAQMVSVRDYFTKMDFHGDLEIGGCFIIANRH